MEEPSVTAVNGGRRHGGPGEPPHAAPEAPIATPSGDETLQDGPAPSAETTALQQLSWVFEAWKQAVEAKNWSDLADLVGLPEVFIEGEPRDSSQSVQHLNSLTEELCNFELMYGDVTRSTLTGDQINLSVPATVLWSSQQTWEDKRIDIMVHAGFRLISGVWKTSYLVMSRLWIEPASKPPAAAGDEPPVQGSQAGPGEAYPDPRAAEAAERYFQVNAKQDEPPPVQVQGKKRIVYMPVIIDADVLKDLLS